MQLLSVKEVVQYEEECISIEATVFIAGNKIILSIPLDGSDYDVFKSIQDEGRDTSNYVDLVIRAWIGREIKYTVNELRTDICTYICDDE